MICQPNSDIRHDAVREGIVLPRITRLSLFTYTRQALSQSETYTEQSLFT